MKDGARLLLRRSPAVAYIFGVFYGGVIDVGALPELPGLSADKVLHLLAFMGLTWLLEFALAEFSPLRRRVLAVVFALGVGGLLELVQAALPYRSADLWDFAADAVGAFLGVGLSWLFRRLWSRSTEDVSAGVG